jgi:hypothetical protein
MSSSILIVVGPLAGLAGVFVGASLSPLVAAEALGA